MMLRWGIAPTIIALVWRFAVVLIAASMAVIAWTSSPMDLQSIGQVSRPTKAPQTGPPASNSMVATVNPSYPAIAARPLFYPSREPWLPPPPAQPAPVSTAPSPLTNYALVGVIVSGHTRSALIKPPGGNKTITLGEGQELGGWTLQEITRDRLRFAAGNASYDMNFLKPSESKR
jgi:type II secretory pathway component PulC